jgi:hypothetical protein
LRGINIMREAPTPSAGRPMPTGADVTISSAFQRAW